MVFTYSAILMDDAMTGDNNSHGVLTYSCCHGTYSFRLTDVCSQLLIRYCFSKWNLHDSFPHF